MRLLLLLLTVRGTFFTPKEEASALRMRTLMSAAADDGVCASLSLRVDSTSLDTATVSFAPPKNASKVRVEFFTGKFPTQEELDVEEKSRARFVMTSLDPCKTYILRVVPLCPSSGSSDGFLTTCAPFQSVDCGVEVSTETSRGHDCKLEQGVDYRGHDMVFGRGGAQAARRQGVGGAKACCDACAAVQPNRPYNDACTHFVYEEATDTCYFKSPDQEGGLGREDREGYVAGKVVPR